MEGGLSDFASVIMWPPVRQGIGETCSELSFLRKHVSTSMLVGALECNYAESSWKEAAVLLLRFRTLLLVIQDDMAIIAK